MDLKRDAAAPSDKMIDPALFEQLKAKIEQDSKARDDINEACETLEKAVNFTQGILTRVHNTPRSQCEHSVYSNVFCSSLTSPTDPAFLKQIEGAIADQVKAVALLNHVASKHPYYK